MNTALHKLFASIQKLEVRFELLPKTTQYASAALSVLIVTLVAVNTPVLKNIFLGTPSVLDTHAVALSLPTETVGSETEGFRTGTSWSGEITSPNDADVQPPREGSIVSWNVSIGQYVYAGQVLGRLSSAPLTPDLASQLAQQAATLAQARAKASSTQVYTDQTKTQIDTLADNSAAANAITQARALVPATETNVRNVLRQALVREYAEFSGNNGDVFFKANSYNRAVLNNFGVANPSLRNEYLAAVDEVLRVSETNGNLDQAGDPYFKAALRLVSGSGTSENYSAEKLDALRKLIADDQNAFNDATQKSKQALLVVAEKENDYANSTTNCPI